MDSLTMAVSSRLCLLFFVQLRRAFIILFWLPSEADTGEVAAATHVHPATGVIAHLHADSDRIAQSDDFPYFSLPVGESWR